MRGLSLLSAVAAAAAFLALSWARGYPWQLALLAAMAIGALIYVTGRTIWNLRRLSSSGRSPAGVRRPKTRPAASPETPER